MESNLITYYVVGIVDGSQVISYHYNIDDALESIAEYERRDEEAEVDMVSLKEYIGEHGSLYYLYKCKSSISINDVEVTPESIDEWFRRCESKEFINHRVL